MADLEEDLNYLDYLDFEPRCILEAGVGSFPLCRSRPFWDTADCWLFEPLPEFFAEIMEAAQAHPRVKLSPHALWHRRELVRFHTFRHSSYVSGVAPRRRPKNQKELDTHAVHVQGAPLSEFDPGTFDVALLDLESSEWYALQHMRSRPRFMSVELYQPSQPNYTHFHEADIRRWLDANGYEQIGRCERDAYFRRTA